MWVPGKKSFYRAPGGNRPRRRVPGASSRDTLRESQAKFKPDRVGIAEGPCGTGTAGSVFLETSFYRETWGTRSGGRQGAKRSSDPEVKVQVRDLVWVVILLSTWPHWGTPRESQAKFKDWTVWGLYKGPVWYLFGIQGKFVLSRNLGYKLRGSPRAKRRSDSRVGYHEVKVHVRDLVRLVDIVGTPLPHWGWVPWENSFNRAQRGNEPRREPGKVQGPDRVGIVEGSYGNLGYKTRGVVKGIHSSDHR